MMKYIKNISLLALLFVMLVGCVEKTPDYSNFPSKDVDFTYGVAGDEYKTDFYVVSKIQFTNTSSKQGAVTWDFGDGQTSNEANPLHKYAKAGNYKVSLSIDGVGTRTYSLMIFDITPVLSVSEQSAEEVIINDVTVAFNIELPNPENLKCKYVWTLPEGTMNENGEEVKEFTGYSDAEGNIEYPGKLKFKHVGSQKISIKTWFDVDGENRRLNDSYANVQVGTKVPCKTLYYAVYGGNIKAYKLPAPGTLPEGTKVFPFDMGLNSGNTPQNLVFAEVATKNDAGEEELNGWLYILDCGKHYTYVNDENGVMGDGKITVMSADGSTTNVCVSNVGQQAFNDPFQGCADDTYLYYTDRNTGIRKIPLTARGEKEQNDYLVQNNWLAYYGLGIAYGAIHTGVLIDSKGTFWWGKKFNGNGIYRFRREHIFSNGKPSGGIPYPIVVSGAQPKAFTIDEGRNALYIYMAQGEHKGFCVYGLPSDTEGPAVKDYKLRIPMDASADNATADEGLFVTQFALDNKDGKVYFGYRTIDDANYSTGMKYFDPATQKIETLYDNTEKILGVAINNNETCLF